MSRKIVVVLALFAVFARSALSTVTAYRLGVRRGANFVQEAARISGNACCVRTESGKVMFAFIDRNQSWADSNYNLVDGAKDQFISEAKKLKEDFGIAMRVVSPDQISTNLPD